VNLDPQVFVSHAHEDALFAGRVAAALEAEGVGCWIAPRDIAPGSSWDDAIVGALDHASTFVLIFSRFANTSRQVAKELTLADSRGLDIRPVRVDQTMPAGAMEYHLSRPQWVDVSGLPDVDRQVAATVGQLRGRSSQALVSAVQVGRTAGDAFENPDEWGRSARWFGGRSRSRQGGHQ
jgi:hypothetical protein